MRIDAQVVVDGRQDVAEVNGTAHGGGFELVGRPDDKLGSSHAAIGKTM